jgi:hypothetical protein
MTRHHVPQLVEPVGAIEPYPIGRDERLDGHSFMKWWHQRWMASRTFKLASWEAQGMAFGLFNLCQAESPVGTLPDDNEELAVMLRTTARRVADLRLQEFGPFRGWRRCRCGAEVRLMHDVVLEQVRDALDRRDTRELSKEAKAEYARLKRLREALTGMKVDAGVVADDVLIRRMDAWLSQHRKGRRDGAAYEAVVMQAAREGWFGAR